MSKRRVWIKLHHWNPACGATKLGIEFHTHIRVVLGGILRNLDPLYTLGNNPISAVRWLLDTVIHIRVPSRQDEHHHLRSHIAFITNGVEEIHYRLGTIGLPIDDGWVGISDDTAVVTVSFDKIANEYLDGVYRWAEEILAKFDRIGKFRNYPRVPIMATPQALSSAWFDLRKALFLKSHLPE